MSDKPTAYDLIIIGGGSAGLTAAETAVIFGKNIALVAERLGGECLWTGCVPSKALIKASEEAHLRELSPQEGWKLVRDRIRTATTKIRDEHDNAAFYRALGIDVYESEARFIDDRTIEVGGQRLTARKFLICTGSRARVPEIPGLANVPYLTNESIFELEALPESITIIGGGPIGCEMGQAFQRLGSRVTIVQEGSRLMPRDEPEASTVILGALRTDAVEVLLDARTQSVSATGQTISLRIQDATGERTVTSEALLVATGRQPNVERLDLARAGVTVGPHGILHDAHLRTSNPRVFVAGDVAGDLQFTHYASAQAGVAVQNMLVPFVKSTVPALVPWCTFTSPEVAHTGLSSEEAEKRGIKFKTESFPFDRVDRAIAEGRTTGFIQLHLGGGDRILGATIVGEHAGEMIQELTLAISQRLTVEKLLKVIHVYPTFSSGIQQALFYRYLKSDTLLLQAGKLLARIFP